MDKFTCDCGGKTQVIDTEQFPEYIRRRRKCLNPACGKRFSTYEFKRVRLLDIFKPFMESLEKLENEFELFKRERGYDDTDE